MLLKTEEKAVLVGVDLKNRGDWALDESMKELASLSETAGAKVVGLLIQSKQRPDQKFYIGTGKLEELRALISSSSANTAIFNSELAPSQVKNLEEELAIKVIDRTGLILDIFAQHAHSREGKLQVELAQNNYNLTHLIGKGVLMSRLGAGIGTRGPGETKLETDRRMIKARIAALKRDIEAIRSEREIKRAARRAALLPLVAIVGYTNAGKSTLLNALTGAGVLVENKLFATLDPTTRKLKLPSGLEVLVTDTVGFINELPHQLVEAFHATLEEVSSADLLLHVVDSSSKNIEGQTKAVFEVLDEIGAISKHVITVFNKTDLLVKPAIPAKIKKRLKPSVEISAAKGRGLEDLLEMIQKQLDLSKSVVRFEVPINKMDVVNLLHEKGKVKSQKYFGDRVVIEARVDDITRDRFREYAII